MLSGERGSSGFTNAVYSTFGNDEVAISPNGSVAVHTWASTQGVLPCVDYVCL